MGSHIQPGVFDDKAFIELEDAYRSVWVTLSEHDPFRQHLSDDDMRDMIIKCLMELFAEGVTSHEQLRSEALRTLPLIDMRRWSE
jgi:hypothetical protein